jgi:two-component system copper resistance phosphate regulon response regulator CusR
MGKAKILVIEDEQKIANTLKMGLVEQGYLAEVAYDGSAGWTMFNSTAFDLVILDINLPLLSGYDVCKLVREANTRIPIIMLTAFGSLDDKTEGYDAGADDYLVKPFQFKELLMKIRAQLKHRVFDKPPAGNMLKAADLTVNLDTKEVVRNNVSIHLTAKEFQLLEYLLKNKNTVVSRSDIAVNVWDIDFDTNTNVIDVYINYLRNKMDKQHALKLIHTYVGMGYILKDH